MGRHSIEAGNKDSWTMSPKKSDLITELYKAEKTMSGITLKLPNLIEYYTDNEYIVPVDINQSV